MKSYMVKRRLYKGHGEYTTDNEIIKMNINEAEPLLESGAIVEHVEKVEEPEAKGRAKK